MKTVATADAWTDIPDTGGQMLLEARAYGVYVDTSGLGPANQTEGYSLPDGMSVVISAGVPVKVWPIRDGASTDIWYHLV